MMTRNMFAAIVLMLAAGCAVAPAPEEKRMVVNPRVTTDKSVDCSTLKSIVADLTNGQMTDEQKVLAVFNFVRRLVYHGDGCRELAYNVMFTMNVGGNGSCGRQTVIVAALLDQLGYKSQNWTRGGHHLMQVHYGGQWHCFDPHMTFYVYDRSTPPVIASVEQLQNDPTLALDAVKEKRACSGYLHCGDSPKTFAGKDRWKLYGEYPKAWKVVIEEPFGNIALRRGETYARTWMPGKYWFKKNCWMKDFGPFHSCGGRRDKKDTVNWPVYEPHGAKMKYGISYRHWGTGWLEYAPSIANGHYVDGVVSEKNILRAKRDGKMVLAPADDSQPGEVTFAVNCPYVVTASEVTTSLLAEGGLAMAVSIDQGKSWRPITLPDEGALRNAAFVDEVNGARKGYLLRLTLTGAALADLRIVTEFQLNPYSLPNLVPGKNTVRVSAAQYDTPLTARYEWYEGEDWQQKREAYKTFRADGEFTIDVAGPKYPRMKLLMLSVPQ
jgi:hypothetical protein